MKNRSRTITLILLCIRLCMIFIPAVFAADEFSQIYDNNVITGFEPFEYEKTVSTEYKYALVELQKEFPAQITVRVGGKVFFTKDSNDSVIISRVTDFETKKIDTVWKCQENYDEDLEVFHFTPAIEESELAPGVVLPVITVNILGELPIPPLNYNRDESHYEYTPPAAEQSSITKLASYYNNYANGVLPPVRNQNPYGTCWAHATIAAIEADLIHDGRATTNIDLSELHLVYFTNNNFTDDKNCNIGDNAVNTGDILNKGHDEKYAAKRLACMLGPVYEATVPYSLCESYAPDPADGRKAELQITGIYHYNLETERDAVKEAIMNHGAVTAAYYVDSQNYYSYYSSSYNSYYYPTYSSPNHTITLVGWDDGFSAANFKKGPAEGDGAWLVRNSWGKNTYDPSGYFWISYYDHSLDSLSFAYDAELWHYDHIYSYDNSPFSREYNINDGDVVSQIFHVDANEQIKAVGVYFDYLDSPIQNVVFTLKYGNSSVNTKSLTISRRGYYLFPLVTPISLTAETDVTVQTVSSGYEFSTERSANYNYTEYTAYRGSGLRVNGDLKDGDARIKLLTNDLPDLVLPSNVETIESQAFAGGAFKHVKLSEKTVSIGYRAFADCPNLKSIYIPSTTTYIDPEAFGNNSGLIIEGVYGSYAENFASSNGYTFRPD